MSNKPNHMPDWPQRAVRHSASVVFAEARQRGLMDADAGQLWLYMFHDVYGVAHFRHVARRGYMQMLPDDNITDTTADTTAPTATPTTIGERKS